MKYSYLFFVFFLALFSCSTTFSQIKEPAKPVARFPFESKNGTIILSVRINDYPHPLRLLFDTGADGMAIGQALADAIGLKVTRTQNASVVGGHMEIRISGGNQIHIADFVLKNQSIAIFNELGAENDGIIGNALVKNYITRVDYDRKEILLYNFDDYDDEKGGTRVPVNDEDRLISISGTLNIKAEQPCEGKFVFDTGASYNLICFRPFVKQNRLLVSGFKSEYSGATTSMGVTTPTFSGKAASFSMGPMPAMRQLPVTLMAGGGQSESWDPGHDGSIGVRLISRYNFVINLQKKELYFKPNHSFAYPQDFVLGGFLFGFTLDGDLEVLSLTSAENSAISLRVGAKVKKINNIPVASFLKEPKQLEKLLDRPLKTKYIVESVQGTQLFKDDLFK